MYMYKLRPNVYSLKNDGYKVYSEGQKIGYKIHRLKSNNIVIGLKQ